MDDGAQAAGAVVRDAVDQAATIVRDSVAVGSLAARRALRRASPAVLWGALALGTGLVGFVLAAIAIFLGLGVLIASVGVRLALYAFVFLAAAGVFASRAAPQKSR